MTSSSPKISVIIPAYDAQATIVATIESALAQTLPCHEIIVVDDGSKTELAPILTRFGPIVRCLRQKNAGAAAARNTGIAHACGEFIAFLDADDTWEPAKIERQAQIFREQPAVGLVASRYFTQTPDEPFRLLQPCDPDWLDRVIESRGEEIFHLASLIWTGTIIVRRSALAEERFVSGLEPAEDRDLWLRIVRSHRAYVMSAPLATAVLVPGSLSRHDPDSSYEPMIRVLHRHAALVTPRRLRKLEAGVFRSWAAAFLATDRPQRALPLAVHRLRRQPISLQAWWIVVKSVVSTAFQNRRAALLATADRDEVSLRGHFEIERELASRLRAANANERREMYGAVYNELFVRVEDHPQNTRKHSADAQQASARWQMRLLGKFVQSNSRYLELGAGDCHLAMAVAKISRWSYGVDVSRFISSSAEQLANFSMIISDGVRIDVPPGSINVAYSNQLMEHLHPDDAIEQLTQIRRALAPGGKYICITPHRYSGPHDVSKFFAEEACGFHLKEYTYAELRDLFYAAGFASTRVYAGVKGRYLALPTLVVSMIERALGILPSKLRGAISRAPLFRVAFLNVLLVGIAGMQPQPIMESEDEPEMAAQL